MGSEQNNSQTNNCDYEYGNDFSLGNAGDEIILKSLEGIIIDEVIYTSDWVFPESATQLDPIFYNHSNHDFIR